jgi:hypothetical protein
MRYISFYVAKYNHKAAAAAAASPSEETLSRTKLNGVTMTPAPLTSQKPVRTSVQTVEQQTQGRQEKNYFSFSERSMTIL